MILPNLDPKRKPPFHWVPRQGKPFRTSERTSQAIVKCLAWLPVYIAIVTTLTLLVIVYGFYFV